MELLQITHSQVPNKRGVLIERGEFVKTLNDYTRTEKEKTGCRRV